MKIKQIEKTPKSPQITVNFDNGTIEIFGRSIMENAKEFYEPLTEEWIEEYLAAPKNKTVVTVNLEYYNTASSVWIFQFVKKLSQLCTMELELIINWYYSDDDVFEAGEDIQQLLKVPFHFFPTENYKNWLES